MFSILLIEEQKNLEFSKLNLI